MFETAEEKNVEEIISTLNSMLEDRRILKRALEQQRLETAKYKCAFEGKTELRRKIQNQIEENQNTFKLFTRNKTTFRTLEDMKDEGILTEEEYKKII